MWLNLVQFTPPWTWHPLLVLREKVAVNSRAPALPYPFLSPFFLEGLGVFHPVFGHHTGISQTFGGAGPTESDGDHRRGPRVSTAVSSRAARPSCRGRAWAGSVRVRRTGPRVTRTRPFPSGWLHIRPARCWALTSPYHSRSRCVSFWKVLRSGPPPGLLRLLDGLDPRAPGEDVFDQYLGFFLLLDLEFYTKVIMGIFQRLMKNKEVSF